MPPNIAQTLRVRAEIFGHAGRLFRLRGYAGTNIDDIMLAAGLTRGAFYAQISTPLENQDASDKTTVMRKAIGQVPGAKTYLSGAPAVSPTKGNPSVGTPTSRASDASTPTTPSATAWWRANRPYPLRGG